MVVLNHMLYYGEQRVYVILFESHNVKCMCVEQHDVPLPCDAAEPVLLLLTQSISLSVHRPKL